MSTLDRVRRIRELNDALRHSFVGGVVMVTAGVEQLDQPMRGALLQSIRDFTSFDAANDPYDEHDFGAVCLGIMRFFWKIDYYDRDLASGSEDPADPVQTTRVLTIMLASEY